MKIVKPASTIETINEQDIISLENDFLKRYYTAPPKTSPLRRLFKMCKGYHGKLLLSAIFCALQLSATLYIPIAAANVIDALTYNAPDSLQKIVINICIALSLLFINYPLQRIYMRNRDDAARSIEAALRGAIVTKLQHLTIQFNKEMESGRIHSKIMRDVDSIRALISNLLTVGVHIVVNLAVVVGVLIYKGNYQIILFFAVCGPLAVFIARSFKKRIKQTSRQYRRSVEETNARVVDMVDLIPVTKAHALENIEIEKMTHQISSTARKGFELDNVSNRFMVVNWLVMQIFQLLCLALTAYLAFKGIMSVGDLVLYQNYFEKFVSYINQITNLIPTLAAGSEAVNSVGEILGSDDVENDDNKKHIGMLKGEYEFKNVTFKYRDGDRYILNGINMTISAGETIALVGESGSGKSTIINLVTGFDFATGGTLTVDGNDIKDISMGSYRKQIAVVLQNSILFSGTIRDNITYGSPNVSDEELARVIKLSCLDSVINSLPDGLDTIVGEHGNKLSGGQKQRISIARALIRNPRVIIFDEATSALDTVSEKHIQTAIDNLSKDKTTFIVAHRLSTVKNADKIAVIKDGKCVEFGTYNDLIEKHGEFYKFRQLQI